MSKTAEKRKRRKYVRKGEKLPVPIGSEKASLMGLPEGVPARIARKNAMIMQLGPVDLKDFDAVSERVAEYFDICEATDTKPGIAGMASALQINRRRMLSIVSEPKGANGYYSGATEEVRDLIRSYYTSLEAMWEDYMQQGQVNPVTGIFLGKNNFGYRDQTDMTITPQVEQQKLDADEIRKRYLTATDFQEVQKDDNEGNNSGTA